MQLARSFRIVFAVSTGAAPAALVAQQQQAVATSDVNIRTGQSTSSKIVDHLTAGDTVTLVSAGVRKGYYHIERADGTKGWVYARLLTVVGDAQVSSAPTTPAPASPTPTRRRPTAPGNTAAGAAAESVDASWDKPAPSTTSFPRAGFPTCGPDGQGGDALTNHRKNRTDEPTEYHRITFSAMMALPYPKNHIPQRSNWPPTDLAVIAPYEGIAVSVTAFIARQRGIIVEGTPNTKAGESTNCHAIDGPGVDWHMTLVQHPDEPKSAGIVVETTPRVRAQGHPWTPEMLASAISNGDSVRISGWTLYDPEHFPQTTNYDPARPSTGLTVRATLWEVHPVTKIEVFDSQTNTWKSLP